MAVVLQNTWGPKNKRAFKVAVNVGSFWYQKFFSKLNFLSNFLRKYSLQVLATDKRLARIPPICINWEKVELDSPATKVT